VCVLAPPPPPPPRPFLPLARPLTAAPLSLAVHRALPTTEALAIDRVFSKSYITALSDSERSDLEQRLRETIRRGEGREWIDEKEGVFAYPYETDLFVAKRK